ncbi:MAG TPA: hypothetical protein VL309_11115 [Vicinamibacterales bacterium]|nr:hypothetical protein [Vicinamibacterales bacterium]
MAAAVVMLAGLSAVVITLVPLSSDRLKARIAASLGEKLDSEVEIGALSLRVWPGLHVDGASLVIRQNGRRDVPPLIGVRGFTVDATVSDLWHHRVSRVTLDGLDIEIPPERAPAPADGAAPATASRAPANVAGSLRAGAKDYVIDRLEATDARLVIIPDRPDKAPRVWAIHTLAMRRVAAESAMPFQATLTNAIPPGEIETAGTFGPWQRDEPGRTPLQGTYTFRKADLSVFHGIAGTLSSTGTFTDRLNHIDVTGETDTPDFTILVSGHPFPLATRFHTIVDGTNGDTTLERIDATFIESSLVAHGKVVQTPGHHGRTVALDITMDRARLEDVMRMAVKANRPPMVGGLKMTTTFVLPPGENDVVDRLRLSGRFAISRARFTSPEVQTKINELSHRSRGRDADAPKDTVVSDFTGTFALGGGRLSLPSFAFAVPGAQVKLTGRYAIKPELVDFHGDLLMDARVSDTQTGLKRLLLKVVDPLFRKAGGGSTIPIKITGSRGNPSFGVDMHRVFHRGS